MGIEPRKREGYTEFTMLKVYDSLVGAALTPENAQACIRDMLNKGIYFRELVEEKPVLRSHVMEGPHSRACGLTEHKHGGLCAPDCPTCVLDLALNQPRRPCKIIQGRHTRGCGIFTEDNHCAQCIETCPNCKAFKEDSLG